eukprot:8456233-Pyramimonas_sp.AAC.1
MVPSGTLQPLQLLHPLPPPQPGPEGAGGGPLAGLKPQAAPGPGLLEMGRGQRLEAEGTNYVSKWKQQDPAAAVQSAEGTSSWRPHSW